MFYSSHGPLYQLPPLKATTLLVSNLSLFLDDLTFGKKKRSHGAKSGENRMISVLSQTVSYGSGVNLINVFAVSVDCSNLGDIQSTHTIPLKKYYF